MATSGSVSLIIDDTASSVSNFFSFSENGTWNSTTTPGSYLGTSHVASSVAPGGNLSNTVEIIFAGTSLALFGNTAPPTSAIAETFTVIIDGQSQPVNSGYGDPHPPSYRQWYQSPPLSRGIFHNITLTNIVGASVDFAVITRTFRSAASVSGQTVIVDNDDPSITFSGGGNWSTSTATFNGTQAGTITPYGNTTHVTSQSGDSFSFNFPGGSDIRIYGVMDWTRFGRLSLSSILDGDASQRIDLLIQENSSQVVDRLGQQSNYPFFRIGETLSPGTHTLVVNVLECVNQTFTLDYITYISPIVARPAPPQTVSMGDSDKAGAIAGGVLGGLAFLVLAGLLLHCIRRRRRQLRTNFAYPFNHQTHPVNPIPLESMLAHAKGESKGDHVF